MRFVIFLSILTIILGLISSYVASRIIANFSWAAAHSGIVWLTLAVVIVFQLAGPLLYRVYPRRFGRIFILHWAGFTALGVLASMFLYTVASDLISVVWRLFAGPEKAVDFGRRTFWTTSAMALGSSVVGATQAQIGPRIYKVEIPLPRLPKAFDGFRIVQITDLHVGPTIGARYTRNVVDMANDLAPDLLALTGDFADGRVSTLRDSLEPLSQLRSKYGNYFVTGNHEYYWDVDQWLPEYRRLGMRTLLNEHVAIRHNGSEIILAGVTDYSAGHMIPAHRSDPAGAIAGASPDSVKVLLAHQPSSYSAAHRAGYDLMLSGHTHGGQFFPWSIVVGLAHRYYKGLYKHENMWIYVSRGTGYWGPPIRFLVPSEITLLTLRSST